jgi:hypothetical protein
MLDYTALQARAEYKRDQFVHEAAHARLLRQLPPSMAQARATRPTRLARLDFLLARMVLLLVLAFAGIAGYVASAPANSAPALAASEPAPQLSVPVGQNAAGLGCWVTGDLVWSPEGGAGNPAALGQAMCGGR